MPEGVHKAPSLARTIAAAAGTTGLSWATLLKRVFALDALLCPRCGDRRQIIAVYPGRPRLRDLPQRVELAARALRAAEAASG